MTSAHQRQKGKEQFAVSCSPQHRKLRIIHKLFRVKKNYTFLHRWLQSFSSQEITQSKVNNTQLFGVAKMPAGFHVRLISKYVRQSHNSG